MSAPSEKGAPGEGNKNPALTSIQVRQRPRYRRTGRRAKLFELGLKKLRLKKAWLQKHGRETWDRKRGHNNQQSPRKEGD